MEVCMASKVIIFIKNIKARLLHKYTVFSVFGLCALSKALLPIKHIDKNSDYISLINSTTISILQYIPILLLVKLRYYESLKRGDQGNKIKIDSWYLFNVDIFIIVGYICLAILLGLQIYSLTITQVTVSGSIVTLALLISMCMAIVCKIRSLGGVRAIIIGILAVFFTIGFFEIPYQLFKYYIHFYDIMSIQDLTRVITPHVCYLFPFLLLFLLYKIDITKSSLFCLAGYLVLWVIWLTIGDYWTIYIYQDGVWVINEPVNWWVYQVAKTTKVMLILSVFFLGYKGVRYKPDERKSTTAF
jgi:hypothetical protein